ncbi:unnamed protein product [Malus baccata var. baccata]
MLGCECWWWSSRDYQLCDYSEPQPFSLPSPLPHWPQGEGFATGRIRLGEIEVTQITKFESIWSCNLSRGKSKGVTFYRPAGIPDGFFCLGYYCQPNDQPLQGYVLVARETVARRAEDGCTRDSALENDAARSKFFIDSSTKYQIVAAEYLGKGVISEPCWLQYMRDWGPTIVYDGREELDKLIDRLPFFVRFSVENLIELFPTQLYGEEGPTGPKEKDNWLGDER